MPETTTLPINQGTDVLRDTQLTTAGYFTNGAGTLVANLIHTGSLSEANQKYYQNITQVHTATSSAATQFSVAYGHVRGSGSATDQDGIKGPSELIYKQWGSLLLAPTEITGGFKISQQGAAGVKASGVRDDENVKGECNGCSGTGEKENFAKHYPFDEENVKEFRDFVRDSGGFEIF